MDWLGVIALIVAVSCLQLVLDGKRLGWFSSSEIIINTILSATAFYIFVVHCLTTEAPYITLKMLTDRNYVIGLSYFTRCSRFLPIYFAAFLQYPRHPVLSAGWVISSRGLGTMFAMMCSGFLFERFYLILLG